tara:strand:- start:285 stop:1133 length:849 start_codon:yes stop_codon:yes gene_type:complete
MNYNLIKKHAKSFYWASIFLPKQTFKKCSYLYNFCRTLDDIVDDKNDIEIKKINFLKFKKNFENKNFKDPIIKEMWSIIYSEKISTKIVYDLFDGVETDLVNELSIKSKKDLLVYSYRVAGTVGLMMSKILKVENKEALKGAIDLGIAMQLTNIARDVFEDNARNRKYICTKFSSIKDTIKEADIFYQKSFSSISVIPLRTRFSVIVARRIYKKIGDYILKHKDIESYEKAGKIYVPIISKINETFLSIFDFIKLLFIKKISYDNYDNHNILAQEINLNERV